MNRGSIVISDPWDVATTLGSEPLAGNIVIADDEPSLFLLDRPVLVNGVWMTSAEISGRHVGSRFMAACNGIPANIVLKSDDHTVTCATIGTVSIA
jgi:hypothetical protein